LSSESKKIGQKNIIAICQRSVLDNLFFYVSKMCLLEKHRI
jgi:hypothetical protein